MEHVIANIRAGGTIFVFTFKCGPYFSTGTLCTYSLCSKVLIKIKLYGKTTAGVVFYVIIFTFFSSDAYSRVGKEIIVLEHFSALYWLTVNNDKYLSSYISSWCNFGFSLTNSLRILFKSGIFYWTIWTRVLEFSLNIIRHSLEWFLYAIVLNDSYIINICSLNVNSL